MKTMGHSYLFLPIHTYSYLSGDIRGNWAVRDGEGLIWADMGIGGGLMQFGGLKLD